MEYFIRYPPFYYKAVRDINIQFMHNKYRSTRLNSKTTTFNESIRKILDMEKKKHLYNNKFGYKNMKV